MAMAGPNRGRTVLPPLRIEASPSMQGEVKQAALRCAGLEAHFCFCVSKLQSRQGCIMLDLIIRGGDVVTPQGVAKCDVAIKGEVIAAVAVPGALADASATRIIDVLGKIVMPGGIDPHVHMRHPFELAD